MQAMAEAGEWGRKGATLSDVTALKECAVTHEFIVQGIRAGKLEFREGSVWGNPFLRVLRRQLEAYIVEQFGPERIAGATAQTELSKVMKEIAALKARLKSLEARKAELAATGATLRRKGKSSV